MIPFCFFFNISSLFCAAFAESPPPLPPTTYRKFIISWDKHRKQDILSVCRVIFLPLSFHHKRRLSQLHQLNNDTSYCRAPEKPTGSWIQNLTPCGLKNNLLQHVSAVSKKDFKQYWNSTINTVCGFNSRSSTNLLELCFYIKPLVLCGSESRGITSYFLERKSRISSKYPSFLCQLFLRVGAYLCTKCPGCPQYTWLWSHLLWKLTIFIS